MSQLQDLLAQALDRGASDVHLVPGSRPLYRIHTVLEEVESSDTVTPEQTEQYVKEMVGERRFEKLLDKRDLDFSAHVPGRGRFRVNAHYQRDTIAVAFRAIPSDVPKLEDLNLPPIVGQLVDLPRGLILVTGETGAGKSTTLASMIEAMNERYEYHVITIEDPIEYLHPHKGCVVNQREVGADTNSFKLALKYILRQDPDVVLIGEMRDLETIEAALTTAETGHLAFATLHTNSAAQTINRVIDVFPPHQQSQVRAQLSFVLEGVLCQQLIPKASGGGRVMAMEIMVPNAAIRNLIREDKVHQIYSQMQIGQSQHGMMTLNQSLGNLYYNGQISLEECLGRSSEPDELRAIIQKMGGALPDRTEYR